MIPNSIAMLFTNHCNYICDHCSVCADPNKRETISKELMFKIIDQAYSIPSIKLIVFSGGEPTLYIDQLKAGIHHAYKKGFSTRIVSNAWWAQSYEKAFTVISELANSGLTELNISYDDFHLPYLNQFGGEQNIIFAVKAATELNFPVTIGISYINESKIRTRYLEKIFSEAGITGDINYIEDVVTPLGRAQTKLPESSYKNSSKPKGCKDAGTTLLILPDGRICFCCGHSVFTLKDTFTASNLTDEPLSEVIKRIQRNVLVWLLHMKGPEGIFKELGINKTIYNRCEACFYLSTKYKEPLRKLASKKKYLFDQLRAGLPD